MRIGSHEYANEADDDDDVPKPAQSLGTPVPEFTISNESQCFICTNNVLYAMAQIALYTVVVNKITLIMCSFLVQRINLKHQLVA